MSNLCRLRRLTLSVAALLCALAAHAGAQTSPPEHYHDGVEEAEHEHETPHVPDHPHEHPDDDPDDPDHSHVVLTQDDSLSLAEAVSITLQYIPGFQELAAREAQAQSWLQRSRSLIAGRPQLQLRYQSDRLGANDGLVEYEGGLQLPLWRLGERSLVRRLGQQWERESDAAAAALHWEVAGAVREAFWSLELAIVELAEADRRLALSRQLTTLVERRQQLGDASRAEVLLARSAELDALVSHNEAEALLRDTEVAWRTLTTLTRRPAAGVEMSGSHGHIEADHPALRLADAAIARAEQAREQAGLAAGPSPTLTLGPRLERPPQGPRSDGPREDSFGIMISVPLGGAAHTATATAAAGRELAAVRAQRDQLLRELSLQLHEAEHELGVAQRNREAREEQSELTAESLRMAQIAYTSGELELAELLRIQERAATANTQRALARLLEARQRARLQQAIGELP